MDPREERPSAPGRGQLVWLWRDELPRGAGRAPVRAQRRLPAQHGCAAGAAGRARPGAAAGSLPGRAAKLARRDGGAEFRQPGPGQPRSGHSAMPRPGGFCGRNGRRSAPGAADLRRQPGDQSRRKKAGNIPRAFTTARAGWTPQGKVVALFSGQGSQYLEMGRELAVNFPAVREVFGAMDELFLQDELEPLSARVYPHPVFDAKEREALSEALTRTEHAQPAIGSLSVGLYKLLQQAGFQPDFIAGHSFGELTALWAAGVLRRRRLLRLAKARGKAMAPPAGPAVSTPGRWWRLRAMWRRSARRCRGTRR